MSDFSDAELGLFIAGLIALKLLVIFALLTLFP